MWRAAPQEVNRLIPPHKEGYSFAVVDTKVIVFGGVCLGSDASAVRSNAITCYDTRTGLFAPLIPRNGRPNPALPPLARCWPVTSPEPGAASALLPLHLRSSSGRRGSIPDFIVVSAVHVPPPRSRAAACGAPGSVVVVKPAAATVQANGGAAVDAGTAIAVAAEPIVLGAGLRGCFWVHGGEGSQRNLLPPAPALGPEGEGGGGDASVASVPRLAAALASASSLGLGLTTSLSGGGPKSVFRLPDGSLEIGVTRTTAATGSRHGFQSPAEAVPVATPAAKVGSAAASRSLLRPEIAGMTVPPPATDDKAAIDEGWEPADGAAAAADDGGSEVQAATPRDGLDSTAARTPSGKPAAAAPGGSPRGSVAGSGRAGGVAVLRELFDDLSVFDTATQTWRQVDTTANALKQQQAAAKKAREAAAAAATAASSSSAGNLSPRTISHGSVASRHSGSQASGGTGAGAAAGGDGDKDAMAAFLRPRARRDHSISVFAALSAADDVTSSMANSALAFMGSPGGPIPGGFPGERSLPLPPVGIVPRLVVYGGFGAVAGRGDVSLGDLWVVWDAREGRETWSPLHGEPTLVTDATAQANGGPRFGYGEPDPARGTWVADYLPGVCASVLLNGCRADAGDAAPLLQPTQHRGGAGGEGGGATAAAGGRAKAAGGAGGGADVIVRRIVPPPRARHSSVVMGNGLYVYGGVSESGVLGDLWRLDLVAFTWACVWQQPTHASQRSLQGSAADNSDARSVVTARSSRAGLASANQARAPPPPPSGPPPCYASVLTVDPDPAFALRRLYLLVGRTGSGAVAASQHQLVPPDAGVGAVVWRFDLSTSTWEQVSGAGAAASGSLSAATAAAAGSSLTSAMVSAARSGGGGPGGAPPPLCPLGRSDAVFAALDCVPTAVPLPRGADPFYAWLRDHVAGVLPPPPPSAPPSALAALSDAVGGSRPTSRQSPAPPASVGWASTSNHSVHAPGGQAQPPPRPPLLPGTQDLQRLLDAFPDAWALLFLPRRRPDDRTARERAAARAGITSAPPPPPMGVHGASAGRPLEVAHGFAQSKEERSRRVGLAADAFAALTSELHAAAADTQARAEQKDREAAALDAIPTAGAAGSASEAAPTLQQQQHLQTAALSKSSSSALIVPGAGAATVLLRSPSLSSGLPAGTTAQVSSARPGSATGLIRGIASGRERVLGVTVTQSPPPRPARFATTATAADAATAAAPSDSTAPPAAATGSSSGQPQRQGQPPTSAASGLMSARGPASELDAFVAAVATGQWVRLPPIGYIMATAPPDGSSSGGGRGGGGGGSNPGTLVRALTSLQARVNGAWEAHLRTCGWHAVAAGLGALQQVPAPVAFLSSLSASASADAAGVGGRRSSSGSVGGGGAAAASAGGRRSGSISEGAGAASALTASPSAASLASGGTASGSASGKGAPGAVRLVAMVGFSAAGGGVGAAGALAEGAAAAAGATARQLAAAGLHAPHLLFDTAAFVPANDLAGTAIGTRVASEMATARFVLFGGVLLGGALSPQHGGGGAGGRIPAGTQTMQQLSGTVGFGDTAASAAAPSSAYFAVGAAAGKPPPDQEGVARLSEVYQLCVPYAAMPPPLIAATPPAPAATPSAVSVSSSGSSPGPAAAGSGSGAASHFVPLATASVQALLAGVRVRLVDLPTPADISAASQREDRVRALEGSGLPQAAAATGAGAQTRRTSMSRRGGSSGYDPEDAALVAMPLLSRVHVLCRSPAAAASGILALAPLPDAAAPVSPSRAAAAATGAAAAADPKQHAQQAAASPLSPSRSPRAKQPRAGASPRASPPPPLAPPGTPRSFLDVEPIASALVDRRKLLNTLNSVRVSTKDERLGIAPHAVATPNMFVAVGTVDFDGVAVKHGVQLTSVPTPALRLRAAEAHATPFGSLQGDAVREELLKASSAVALARRREAVGIPHPGAPGGSGSGGSPFLGTSRAALEAAAAHTRGLLGPDYSPGHGPTRSITPSTLAALRSPTLSARLRAGAAASLSLDSLPSVGGASSPGGGGLSPGRQWARGGGGGVEEGEGAEEGGCFGGGGSEEEEHQQQHGGGGFGFGAGPGAASSSASAPSLARQASQRSVVSATGGGGGGAGSRHSLKLNLAQAGLGASASGAWGSGGLAPPPGTASLATGGGPASSPLIGSSASALRLMSQNQQAAAAAAAEAALIASRANGGSWSGRSERSDKALEAFTPVVGSKGLSPRSQRNLQSRVRASPFGTPAPMVVVTVMSPLRAPMQGPGGGGGKCA